MDPRDIVDAYLHGRIESWGVFRRLTRLGVSTATALAVAAALPAAVRANDAGALKAVGHTAQESPLVDLLMSHLASQLEKVEAGGPIRPLAATLARIGGNNSNLLNCGGRTDCDPIKLNVNDGFNNLNGELVPDPKGNMMLNLNGSIGQSNVNLFGFLDQPNNNNNANNNNGNNANVGNVNMNFVGNVGEVPLNLNGNLGNLNNSRGDTNKR